jgi:hypothetical protein
LVGGVRLPDRMHGRGPLGAVPEGPAAGGSAAQPRLAQPAAQAASGGQGGVGEMLGQDQANQFGSPVGVLLAEGLGLQEERRGGLRAGGRPVIGRRGNLPAVVASQAEQVVDCPQGESKALGQGLGGQPALAATKDGLTDRRRNGAWHDKSLPKNAGQTDRDQRH